MSKIHVAVAPEMSKEEREAAINQKIEEIRQKNASINRRYEEIENDKKNAENFSLEATQRAKTRPENEETNHGVTETIQKERKVTVTARMAKESRRIKQVTPSTMPVATDFRPQRLSESDLPPPDPVFSYLTDRLREGAFCAPISSVARRKHSTSSQGSEMSIGGSSGSSNSRRTSTDSNSSWTSDSTSSKYCGFANYQPPRKYSACHDYVRNRRMSEQVISTADRENGIWEDNQLAEIQRSYYQDAKKSSQNNKDGNGQQDKTKWMSSDTKELQTSLTSPVTRGSTRPPLRRASSVTSSRSENVTNWRDRRISFNSTEELGFISVEEGVARLTVAEEDTNNNGDMINLNLPVPAVAYD